MSAEDFLDGRGEDAREVRLVKFKLSDKQSGLETLARRLGMFKDKVELTGKDGGPIEGEEASARERVARRIARLLSESERNEVLRDLSHNEFA